MDIAVFEYHIVKLKESEKRDKNQELARELKTYEGDNVTNCNTYTWNIPWKISKMTGTVENRKPSKL